jgi:hypothetical protein
MIGDQDKCKGNYIQASGHEKNPRRKEENRGYE